MSNTFTYNHPQSATIYLGGGCFWGIQQLMKGINSATLRFVPEEDMAKEGYGYLLEEKPFRNATR